MNSTSSVSQGSFLFLPKGFSLSSARRAKKRKLEPDNKEKWEKSFNKFWSTIEKEVKEIYEQLFKKVLAGLIQHMKTLHSGSTPVGILPCEVLLTGTNLPDHNLLISSLTDSIKKEVTPYVSVLWSRTCGNLKHSVVALVQQILQSDSKEFSDFSVENSDSEDDGGDEKSSKIQLQMSQYNMSTLCAWYYGQKKIKDKSSPVVIFFPDFESFSFNVLSELIRLLSSYSSQVPMILIFGVATTSGTVYQSLPRNVLSQLAVQSFKSEPSISFLNHVIEKIFFSEKCPFRLGANCITFLTDIFLFHSFSVQGFVQGYKFCMLEHFYKKNYLSLCCLTEEIEEQVKQLSDDEVENIRKIRSFQKFVEEKSKEDRKLLLLDNEHTRKVIGELIKEAHEYLSNFHVALKCLHILTQDLPQAPLGRHLREYYCKAVSTDIRHASEYKDCMKILRLQSRSELTIKVSLLVELLKLNSLLDILSLDKNTKFEEISLKLESYKNKLDEIGNVNEDEVPDPKTFEETRNSLIQYVETEVVEKLLKPIVTLPLQEIILFDDLPSIRRRISGAPRGAIHLALNNPHFYLDCSCCKLPHPEAVLPTLPDTAIAYKLHLEFGKIIKLYDWLQAFAVCVKPEMTEKETEVDEEIQARFTRAVSELQFLGFIKPSRSKADYVTRLTWGNT